MDERGRAILEELMKISRSSLRAAPERKKVQFPCEMCGGTGTIFIRNADGAVTSGSLCPACKKARDLHFWLRKSGISPKSYAAFTLESFKTDNVMAYEMKRTAEVFLKDPNAKGLGFFGRPGTGKTHICIATCQAMERPHYYWQYQTEIQKLKAVMFKGGDEYRELITKAETLPWLYIDDLFKGAIKGGEMQSQDQRIMFEILNMRQLNHVPTIVSSEFPLNVIIAADEGIGSRLKEMLEPYVYTVHGENRRLRGA